MGGSITVIIISVVLLITKYHKYGGIDIGLEDKCWVGTLYCVPPSWCCSSNGKKYLVNEVTGVVLNPAEIGVRIIRCVLLRAASRFGKYFLNPGRLIVSGDSVLIRFWNDNEDLLLGISVTLQFASKVPSIVISVYTLVDHLLDNHNDLEIVSKAHIFRLKIKTYNIDIVIVVVPAIPESVSAHIVSELSRVVDDNDSLLDELDQLEIWASLAILNHRIRELSNSNVLQDIIVSKSAIVPALAFWGPVNSSSDGAGFSDSKTSLVSWVKVWSWV